MNADFHRLKTGISQVVAGLRRAHVPAQRGGYIERTAWLWRWLCSHGAVSPCSFPIRAPARWNIWRLRRDHAPAQRGGAIERGRRHSGFSCRAFSLIELLVVVALIALLATFAVPAVGSLNRSNAVTRAQQLIEQQLVSARQTALARNRRVEVRFYKFTEPGAIGNAQTFRAVQAFLIDENNKATPVGRMAKLPDSVLLNEVAANSSLLVLADKTWDASNDPQVSLPGVGTSYTAKAFQFRPDGSTGLTATNMWFVTIHSAINGATAATPPSNFATVQVDPVSGAVRSYRP